MRDRHQKFVVSSLSPTDIYTQCAYAHMMAAQLRAKMEVGMTGAGEAGVCKARVNKVAREGGKRSSIRPNRAQVVQAEDKSRLRQAGIASAGLVLSHYRSYGDCPRLFDPVL